MYSHHIVHQTDPRFVILVHGGAWNIPPELRPPHSSGVGRAYDQALSALRSGAEPLDAVVRCIATLEDDPVFDAGTGSFLNEDGTVELDASIMEGAGLRAGAVAGISRFRNPCAIARAVMEKTPHVLLVGEGAERLALAEGFRPVEPRSLVTEREQAAHQAWVKAGRPDARVFFDDGGRPRPEAAGGSPGDGDKRGTVGVVIGVHPTDGGSGPWRLFAANSTGGIPGKRRGRVGDVPLIGCGLYADNEGAAVACTGWGEAFIRMAAAKTVSERCRGGEDPQAAVESVLADILRRTGGRGGIIAIDGRGRTGAAFTTPDMAFAGPSPGARPARNLL
jgi:L-asparaginase / beta-aspartyl-peptidase